MYSFFYFSFCHQRKETAPPSAVVSTFSPLLFSIVLGALWQIFAVVHTRLYFFWRSGNYTWIHFPKKWCSNRLSHISQTQIFCTLQRSPPTKVSDMKITFPAKQKMIVFTRLSWRTWRSTIGYWCPWHISYAAAWTKNPHDLFLQVHLPSSVQKLAPRAGRSSWTTRDDCGEFEHLRRSRALQSHQATQRRSTEGEWFIYLMGATPTHHAFYDHCFCFGNTPVTRIIVFQHLNEGARIQSQLQSSLMLLTKTKEKYEKAFGASERALDAYQKADADLNLSRAEVEKQRMNSTIKSQQYDDCKNEYANQLQKTNELQGNYYNNTLPAVFQNLQDMDERRIKGLRSYILKAVHVEKEVLPIVSQCLDGMVASAESIDEKEVNFNFRHLWPIYHSQIGFENCDWEIQVGILSAWWCSLWGFIERRFHLSQRVHELHATVNQPDLGEKDLHHWHHYRRPHS